MIYDVSHIRVHGKPLERLPSDLFIPPEALEVFLEIFEGPLDVLLYLIRKQDLVLENLPLLLITQQYLEYIRVLHAMNINLAADYLVMAATLAQMKSCLLLPKSIILEDEEEDPRLKLIEQLKAYEVLKEASIALDARPREERDVFVAQVSQSSIEQDPLIEIPLSDLVESMKTLIRQQQRYQPHKVEAESFSLEDTMQSILLQLKTHKKRNFLQLIHANQGISGMIVHFLAILQLNTSGQIKILTTERRSQIYMSLNECSAKLSPL